MACAAGGPGGPASLEKAVTSSGQGFEDPGPEGRTPTVHEGGDAVSRVSSKTTCTGSEPSDCEVQVRDRSGSMGSGTESVSSAQLSMQGPHDLRLADFLSTDGPMESAQLMGSMGHVGHVGHAGHAGHVSHVGSTRRASLEELTSHVSLYTFLVSLLAGLEGQDDEGVEAVVRAHASVPVAPMPQKLTFEYLGRPLGHFDIFPYWAQEDHIQEYISEGFKGHPRYVPCDLEVYVGQMVELWPRASPMPGVFTVVPSLPLGVAMDERTGVIHGRPQRATPQVEYCVTQATPSDPRFPPRGRLALFKLTVVPTAAEETSEGPQCSYAAAAAPCD